MNDARDPADVSRSLPIEAPWPLANRDECRFYHCIDLPNGEFVAGDWDFRGQFEQYIGGYPLAGKTVLDVGTASGFLAFSAERAGATVTALDCRYPIEFDLLPFRDTVHYIERRDWLPEGAQHLAAIKRGFWYAWHKLGSRVHATYTPIHELGFVDDRFDVVFAGAIVEHLADPVSAIGNFARLANEAVIIAFTDVASSSDLVMRTMNDWTDPVHKHTWWMLSRGLYKRLFENLGFTITLVPSVARRFASGRWQEVRRQTIVARRVR